MSRPTPPEADFGSDDALSPDVLKSIVGGAGAVKKIELNAENAAAMSMGAEDLGTSPPHALKADVSMHDQKAATKGIDVSSLKAEDAARLLSVSGGGNTVLLSSTQGSADTGHADGKAGAVKALKVSASDMTETPVKTGMPDTGAFAKSSATTAPASGMSEPVKLSGDDVKQAENSFRSAVGGDSAPGPDGAGKSVKVELTKSADGGSEWKSSGWASPTAHESAKAMDRLQTAEQKNTVEQGKLGDAAIKVKSAEIKIDQIKSDFNSALAKEEGAKVKIKDADKAFKDAHPDPKTWKWTDDKTPAERLQLNTEKVDYLTKQVESGAYGADHAHRVGALEVIDHLKAENAKLQTRVDLQNAQTERTEGHDERIGNIIKKAGAQDDLSKAEKAVMQQTIDANKAEAELAKARQDATKKAVEDKMVKDDQNALKNVFQEQGRELGATLARDVAIDVAKEVARAEGNLHENPLDRLVAGTGVTQTATVVDGAKVTVTSISQVKDVGGTMTYATAEGGGAGAEAGIKRIAEAGTITKTEVGEQVTTTKVYANASAGAEAGAHVSSMGAEAKASVKVSVHAEASHTTEVAGGSQTLYAQADAAVGAKAGATIGLSGVDLQASAKAEAIVQAGIKQSFDIGNGTKVEADAKVYAKASAEAKASAHVDFDPSKGTVGAGAKAGAEVMFGVGAEGTGKVEGKGGGYAEVGGGVYAGKIGAKADVGVGFKNGAIVLDVDLGVSLGIGTNVKISCKANVVQTAKTCIADFNSDDVYKRVMARDMLTNPINFLTHSIFG